MNFELHTISSREGYEKYPHDGYDNELKRCAVLHQEGETLVISRSLDIIHYVYLYTIGPKSSKEYVGLSLSFNGVYFHSTKKAYEVMGWLFESAVYGGLFVHVDDKGQVEFNQQPFYHQAEQYNQLKRDSQRIIDSLPKNSFTALPRSFRIGQGTARVRIEEGEDIVSDYIEQYDRVAVLRKAEYSGLNDIQKRLERLHKQNIEWEQKYNQERKKKKQYSLVVILTIILLGCITGFWLLNEVLNDKDIAIRNLKGNVNALGDTVIVKSEMIAVLAGEKQMLNDSISCLERSILAKTDSIELLQKDKENLQNHLCRLQTMNEELGRDNRLAKEQLKSNSTTITNLRAELFNEQYNRTKGEEYKIWSSSGNTADIYYFRYGTGYDKTGWTIKDNAIVHVCYINNGFAMTSEGYVLRVKDIKKL